ncbi:MAG: peptidylprolyl isomerase [Planctomycetes bacterium]|jgi:peptidyl-prolyl cis-trans isomerase B (cyclophilin B)|nr:peptidylprolyl isomerase [Planctomycetota bacterium]
MAEPLPQVKMETSKGEILLELFEDDAPNTVANFVNLVETGFYDGIVFHRVIPNFVIQGGDPQTKDPAKKSRWGTGGPGWCIDCETKGNPQKHGPKVLSMAHAGLNTGGSQFFITHVATPHLDGKHTVFGRVVEGQAVVDAVRQGDTIVKATVTSKRNHIYEPQKNDLRR